MHRQQEEVAQALGLSGPSAVSWSHMHDTLAAMAEARGVKLPAGATHSIIRKVKLQVRMQLLWMLPCCKCYWPQPHLVVALRCRSHVISKQVLRFLRFCVALHMEVQAVAHEAPRLAPTPEDGFLDASQCEE